MHARVARSRHRPSTQARRVVVKVGSALLVDREAGRVNRAWLETLVAGSAAPAQARPAGHPGVLRRHRPRPAPARASTGPLRLEESQAAAAVGQIRLAHAYKELLEESDVTVAQVLLTLEDSERRRRYLNARATLESLLELGRAARSSTRTTRWRPPRSATATTTGWPPAWRRWPAPIAWCCSRMWMACTRRIPTMDPGARVHSARCAASRREIEAMAGGSASDVGSGGMATKILAARIAVAAGCHMCIAAGRIPASAAPDRGGRAAAPGSCPAATPAAARKQWIAGTLRPSGALVIDAGALRRAARGQQPAAGRRHRRARPVSSAATR